MTKPEELSTPRITKPLHEGAEVVEVSNFTPKAEVIIFSDQDGEIGKGSCWYGRCTFALNPGLKLKSGHKITARQIFNNVSSEPTRNEHAVIVEKIPPEHRTKEKLLTPLIEPPLYDCQRIVSVKNVVEGAHVQVFLLPETKNPIGSIKTPWNYARPGTAKLKEGQKLKADQKLIYQSDLSKPGTVKLKPTQKEMEAKHKPELNEDDLVVGSNAIAVHNLIVGAEVKIYYENQSTKKTVTLTKQIAPWSGTIFQVKPLKAEWVNCKNCIKASQSLCEIEVISEGSSVKGSFEKPVIRKPICPGSFEITVCNAVPRNSTLKVFRKGKSDTQFKQVGQQGAIAYCTTVTLGGTLTLKDGDEIYVTKEKESLKKKSDTVKIVAQPDSPVLEIDNGTLCKPCPGHDAGPIFVHDTLTAKSGPVFKAAMCGTESAEVEIRDPKDNLIKGITLEEIKGKKGYFEGAWDWKKIGSTKIGYIMCGKYRATFMISSPGPKIKQDRYLYVTAQGCVDCSVIDFHQTCVDRINKLRAQENKPPLKRYQELEGESDLDAKVNYKTNTPHKRQSGNAQNECGLQPSISQILDECLEQQMYREEKKCYERHQKKDPKACYSLKDNPACECQYGHYHNMIVNTSYKKVACGIYVTPQGKYKAVINFFT